VTRFLEATRERFLLAIAASLPAERFIELHFFAAIRQVGVESGVAVIAAHPERIEEPILADAPPPSCHPERSPDWHSERSPDCHSERSEESVPLDDEPVQIPRPLVADTSRDRRFAPRDDNRSDFARNDNDRYTVYAAKYRLVLKGPDRGKWECSVVAEADAPLVTVETVVRGVQRRSGDAEEPERMSGDDARNYVLAATR